MYLLYLACRGVKKTIKKRYQGQSLTSLVSVSIHIPAQALTYRFEGLEHDMFTLSRLTAPLVGHNTSY